MPYFYQGELLMFAMVRAHWIDVGGMSTGFGAGPTVADPWLEGLQLDQLKIYEAGKLNETLYRVLKDNIRFPESSLGDMKSQMAACRLAARRMDELFDKYGRDTILHGDRRRSSTRPRPSAATWCRSSPTASTRRRPRSTRTACTRGEPVPIHAKVTIDKGDDDHRPVRLLEGAHAPRSIRARSPAPASPTRRSPARSIRSTRARSARSR